MSVPIRLLYAEPTFTNDQLVDFVRQAWEEIYDLEYEVVFGGWRGVHSDDRDGSVHVTWDNSYGGPPLGVYIHRESGEVRLEFPPREFIEREEANLHKLMKIVEGF